MSFIVVFLIVIAGLFAVSFFAKRRLGVLGLALAAGTILSNLWVKDLTPMIVEAGVVVVRPPLENLVAAGLILLPALLLLSSGPSYKNMRLRVLGSLMFALLAAAFLRDVFESALIIEGPGQQVYESFARYSTVIITLGLALSVLDLLMTKTPKPPKEH